jgi:hypothetical protein
MTVPAKLASVLYRMNVATPEQLERRVAQLRALAGVSEVVVVAEEGMAYLKVDRRVFKETSLP